MVGGVDSDDHPDGDGTRPGDDPDAEQQIHRDRARTVHHLRYRMCGRIIFVRLRRGLPDGLATESGKPFPRGR